MSSYLPRSEGIVKNHDLLYSLRWENFVFRERPVKIPERAVRIGGMAFDRLYANIIFFSTLPFAGAADTAKAQFDGLTTSLFFVMVAFALAYFFSCRNTSRLMESRAVLAASCVMVLLGSIGMMPGMLDRVPSLFSGGLAGFGSTVLFIAWLGVFTRKTVTGSIIELGLAFGFAFAAAFCLSLLGSDVFVLAMALCPILSFAALMFLRREAAGNVVTCRHSSKAGRRLEYRNLIYVFFFGCIMGIMRNYSASHIFGEQSRILDSALFLSGLVVCLAAVVVARLADVSPARFLYRISFVFIMMSSILLAFGRENIAIATPIAFVGMQCFTCCLIARAMLASWALGGSPWRKCIASFGVLYAGEFVGVASALILVGKTSVMACSVVLAGCVLVGYVFFFTEADFLLISKKLKPSLSEEGVDCATVGGGDDISASDEYSSRSSSASVGAGPGSFTSVEKNNPRRDIPSEPSIDEICECISAEFGLTPRESEILPSVARGRTIARIQEELFISGSTVNTHIRHIYSKCGVSNRQELLDFVDDRRRASMENGLWG